VKLDWVVLRRARLPLVSPFRTSFGAQIERDVLLVEVKGPDADGWGECVAMAEPLYSPEYVDGAHAVIKEHLLPRLAGAGTTVDATDVRRLLVPVKGHQMAKAVLEMAILDADLRAAGQSLASYLGATRSQVAAGVSIGMASTVDELLDVVAGYLEQGYARVKLKIEPGWDVEPVGAVRDRFGAGLMLQVDANSAYTLADAADLERLDAFGLVLIEQPLGEHDLAGHTELARRIATPICLDESITSAQTAVDAIERGACSIINIKAGRVGGYLEAKRVHDACLERDVPVWCGGMLETGLGRAANLALAALPGFSLPGDLSASDRYFLRDLTDPFVLEDGHLRVPTGPGLGVVPDPGFLAEVTSSLEEFSWESLRTG
jgi:O-succinylbenzoate synthase